MPKLLMLAGAALFALGAVLWLVGRTGLPFGRLPGDILIKGKNTTFYFPLMTCLLISVVLSLLSWLFRRR